MKEEKIKETYPYAQEERVQKGKRVAVTIGFAGALYQMISLNGKSTGYSHCKMSAPTSDSHD